jgi:hypothetical protein
MSKKSKTSSYVLTLRLKYNISDKSALDKYFELSRRLYNAILGETLKRFNLMRDSKLYQQARKETDKKIKKDLFANVEIKYGFREYDISVFATKLMINEYSSLGSHIKAKLVKRAFDAVNRLRFDNAKKVNFVRYNEMYSIEGADNRQAIKYRDGIVVFNKLKMPIIIENNDLYAQKAIQDRVKYCRLLKKNVKGKDYYYIQLVLEGIPPQKANKETGEVKLYITEGDVGIDIGTQTIAYCCDSEVKLLELAPEIENIEKQKRKLQRKMDRSKRAMNPNKYNEDGTIIKGNRDKWVKSNHYIKTQNGLKGLQQKQADIRKQSHNKLANHILKLGDKFYVETMNYSGLQKRSKKTTINKKTGKFNKKKRFGKSLANKAPAKFIEIINRKLKYFGTEIKKINTYTVKASQYNHFEDAYIKKDLSERWNVFKIGDKDVEIQRDLYSAFLIMNVNNLADKVDRGKCIETFKGFNLLHDIEIERLRNCGNKLISSMGI